MSTKPSKLPRIEIVYEDILRLLPEGGAFSIVDCSKTEDLRGRLFQRVIFLNIEPSSQLDGSVLYRSIPDLSQIGVLSIDCLGSLGHSVRGLPVSEIFVSKPIDDGSGEGVYNLFGTCFKNLLQQKNIISDDYTYYEDSDYCLLGEILIDLSGCNFSNVKNQAYCFGIYERGNRKSVFRYDLARADFSNFIFDDIEFKNTNFTGANLENASFVSCKFDTTSTFKDAIFKNTIFVASDLKKGVLTPSQAAQATVLGVNSNLKSVVFPEISIVKLDISRSNIKDCVFSQLNCGDLFNCNGARVLDTKFFRLQASTFEISDSVFDRCLFSHMYVFSNLHIDNTVFKQCHFAESSIDKIKVYAEFDNCTFENTSLPFSGCKFTNMSLTDQGITRLETYTIPSEDSVTIVNCNVSGILMRAYAQMHINVIDCDATASIFSTEKMSDTADFSGTDLRGAVFLCRPPSTLTDTQLQSSFQIFPGADASYKDFTTLDFKLLRQRISDRSYKDIYLDFKQMNLSHSIFTDINMDEFRFENVNFSNASLERCVFSKALKNVVFNNANLSRAQFLEISPNCGSFVGANLRGAVFLSFAFEAQGSVSFQGADVTNAVFLCDEFVVNKYLSPEQKRTCIYLRDGIRLVGIRFDYLQSLHLQLKSADLVNCVFDAKRPQNLSFSECTLDGCSLNQMQLGDVSFYRSEFTSCSFDSSVFFETSSWSSRQPKIRDCVFVECSFVDTQFLNGELENCTFVDCDFTGVTFDAEKTKVVRCSYEGVLKGATTAVLNLIKRK